MEQLLEMLNSLGMGVDVVSAVIAIVAYVLQAVALYTIATRRGIQKPWLAWIPVVNVWMLGSISDQYRYVTKREVKSKRKVLLGLNIALTVLLVALLAIMAWIVIELLLIAGEHLMELPNAFEDTNVDALMPLLEPMLAPLLLVCALSLPLSIIAVTFTVFYWMALYDVFNSCEPSNGTTYLIVGIVGGFIVTGVESVLLMVCRNKDLGMPPRKEAPAPVEALPQEEPWVQE